MEAFSKLTSALLQALETREPTVDLLDSFIDHWKSITNYYIETTDDSRPVKQTEIPWRLKQMLDILVYEEKQHGAEQTGPCIDYLLKHKLLETLCTLGKAQYPPGMVQQVFLFFSRFLSQMQKHLLQLLTVYRPVQKLIGLCALPGSQTEKEEAQFLLVVCSRVKLDPNALTHILEIPDQSQSSSQTSGLLHALLTLTKSQRASVGLKACQSLLTLSALKGEPGEILSERSHLGALMAGQLRELHSLLPLEGLDSGQLQNWPHTPWSSQFSESSASDHVTNFFSWFDFLDHMMREAPQVLAVKLAQSVHQLWLLEVVEPQLQNTCEQSILLSTSLLCAVVRLVGSSAMLDQLVHFLMMSSPVSLLLLQHCDHISDQISMASLSLVDELLQKPHRDILDALVLTFLKSRGYLSPNALVHEDSHRCNPSPNALLHKDITGDSHRGNPSPNALVLGETHRGNPSPNALVMGDSDRGNPSPNALVMGDSDRGNPCPNALVLGDRHTDESYGDSDGLEEDPFFSDSLFSSAPLPQSSAADAVNSFLCLVPVEVRSAHLLQEGGYESYVHDAHTLVTECRSLSLSCDWPLSLPPHCSEPKVFFEGHLLKVLFDRLGRVLEQPYELNLQLTAVLSRLSSFDHPLLHEYLLNPFLHTHQSTRSMFSVLVRLMGELVQRIQNVPNLPDKLLNARRNLMGLEHSLGTEHVTLLKAVIVLEEFCKELAAITFVKLPLDQQ